MKIDFKTNNGEKVNYGEHFVDSKGIVYKMSPEGFLYEAEGVIASERKERVGKTPHKSVIPNVTSRKYKW